MTVLWQLREMPSRCTSCLSGNSREAAECDSNVYGVGCTGTGSAAAAGPSSSAAATTTLDIPVVADGLSFDETAAAELRKLDELAEAQRRQQRRRWQQEVDIMRDEIVELQGGHRSAAAAARRCRSQSPTAQDGGGSATGVGGERAARRRQPRLPRNYFRKFFDTSGFDQQTVRVSVERGTLVVGVDRLPAAAEKSDDADDKGDTTTRTTDRRQMTRYYRFPMPPSVDLATVRAVLSTDGVLLVEADTCTGTLSSPEPEHSVGSSGTDSGSAGPPTTGKREKIGKPVFMDDEDGKRRMHLLIDVGDSFRPKDIYVQAIKSDRFQVCLRTLSQYDINDIT